MTVQTKNPLVTFIHVPKNAGTSIRKWMMTYCQGQLLKVGKHVNCKLVKDSVKEIGWSFGVVRNPWDRVVSYYHYRLKHIDQQISKPKKFKKLKQIELLNLKETLLKGFDYFVKSEDWKLVKHKQKTYLEGVDFVLRYENLENDFKIVQNKLNCYEALRTHNKSEHADYKTYYTSDLIDIVAERCKTDIDHFNYTFE